MVLHACQITTAAIRLAGQVPADMSLSHVGTSHQEASLRVGELLIYLRDPRIADNVAQLMTQARRQTAALPNLIGPSRVHLPVRIGLVGVIVRLGGDPATTATFMPGRPGVAQPAHMRLEIGPIAFEVCDQIAWHSLTHAWTLLHRQLTALE